MGQRNATYIIVEHREGKNVSRTITPIYNQWNHIQFQSSKMVRGIKAVLKHNWNYFYWNLPIDLIYFVNAGTNEYTKNKEKLTCWAGGNIETNIFKNGDYTAAFQEDNNNGWNIVKFILKTEKKKYPEPDVHTVEVEIYCVVGSEDNDEATSLSPDTYFIEKNNKKEVAYLKQFKWNNALKVEAAKLLKELVAQGVKERKEIITKTV